MKIFLRITCAFVLLLIVLVTRRLYKKFYFPSGEKLRHEFAFHELPQLDNALELATLLEIYKGQSFIQIDSGKNEKELVKFVDSVLERWPSIKTYYLIGSLNLTSKIVKNKKLRISRADPMEIHNKLGDLSVDLLYMNDSISYCDVYKMLYSLWPKLRYGCIIAGSNYSKSKIKTDADFRLCLDKTLNGVREAVDKFSIEKKINEVKFIPESNSTLMFYFMKRF
jgi:hypothetical protein